MIWDSDLVCGLPVTGCKLLCRNKFH